MRGARAVLLAAAVLGSAAALQAAEATTPSLSSTSMDMRNTGTWAATLTLTFNTPMQVHTSEADTLSEIVIKRNRASGNYFEANASAAGLEFSGNTVKLFFDPAGKERLRNISDSYASLYISGTALKSADTATALAQVGSLGFTSGSDLLTYSASDLGNWGNTGNDPPLVASAAIDRDNRVLYITTDEGIAYGKYEGSSDASDKTYPTAFQNHTKYHLRNGAAASMGGVTMSSSNAASVHGSPAVYEMRITLSSSQFSTVSGYANPYLHIDAGAFSSLDHHINPNQTTNNAAISKQINYLPRLTAAELQVGTRALSLTFDESVTRGAGSFYIRNSDTGAYAASTDVAGTLSSVSGTAGAATLSAPDVAKVLAMATPHLHLNSGAVADSGGADNVKKVRALTITYPTPELSGATIDRSSGAVTLAFNTPVTKSTGNIDIREGSGAAHDPARDVRTAASSAAVSASGSAVTFALSPADLAKVAAMASPHAYLAPSVALNLNSSPNAALTAGLDVVLSPQLASASLVPATRALSVTFSESVSAPAASPGSVYAASTGDTDGFTSGTDVRLPLSGTAAAHSATISAAELARVLAMTDPRLYAEANAAAASGLANAAGSIDLPVTAPALSSAAVDIGTGAVTLTFSYAVSAGAGNIDITDTGSAAYDPSAHVRTAVSNTTVSGNQLSFTLSETDRKKIIALGSTLWARLPAGAVSGGAGGNVSAASLQFSVTADTTAPTLTAAPNGPALDEGTGILTLKFSESVKEGSDVDLEKIFITDSATASGGTALSATGDVSELTSTVDTDSQITIKLREAARLAAIGHATPYVYLGAGAVKDLSNQNVAASTVAVEIDDTADDDPPVVESAALDEGAGILTITFNETVDVSSASSNGASFKMREAGAAAGSQGEVALSDGEIAASQSDGTTFVFNLSEASRQGAIAMTAPYLHVAAGAITDVISPTANGIAANADGTAIGLTPDAAAPTIVSAEATALNSITVAFSETVKTADTAGQGWSISGTDAGSLQVTGSSAIQSPGSTTVVLTLSGNLPDTNPDVALRYETSGTDVGSDTGSGSGAVTDTSNNALAARSSIAVSDGIKPEIVSARITGPNEITITYSEAVTAAQSDYASALVVTARTISGLSGGTTDTHTLTFSGAVAGTDATGSVTLDATRIRDAASNALGTSASLSRNLADGQSPAVTSATATSLREITVTFSESLASSGANAQGWSVSGGDAGGRTVVSSSGSGSSLVLTLSSDLDDTKPDGVLLRYKTSPGDVGSDPGSGSGAIRDGASNALAARPNIAVSDGIAPAVSSAKYTSRNAVELTFSEPVRLASGSAPTGWAATGADAVASPTNASSITTLTTSSATSAAVLTLDADLADKTLLDFTLSYSNGNIEDESDNALVSYSEKPDDGIAPVVLSAQSRALNEITVIFSEAVTATGTAGAGGWTISGSDSNSRLVSSRTGISSAASNTLTLRLDGNLNEPIGTVTLAYDGSADAKDRSDNALAAQSVSVSQNLPPTISSAKITGPNQATITYSEPVTASAGAYSGLTVGAARSITSYTQTSAAAHVLVFGGPSAGTGASGTLTIDQSKISDGVLNLGTSSVQRNLTDGQVPTFSAGVTDERTVLVTFSEQVSSSDNAASHWTLSGADARAVSSVSALSNSGTMTITVGADFAANVADLKISYSAAGTVSDSAGNALASVSNAAVSDEQRPSIASAVARTDNSITVTLTRSSSGSATDAGTTWTLSGADAAGLSVSGYLGVSSDMVTLALSGNLPDTAPDLSLSYDSSVGDIADSAGKQMTDQTVAVSDGLKPRIDGAALNEGTGVLTVTFTEQVTVASGLHLRESGASGGIPLPSASGTVLSFTLSEAQRQQAVAFATPSLRMEAGAAADGAGLSSDAADVQVSATADAVPPVAGSAALDLGTGILTISFDENLGPASDPSLLSISGSLTGAQVSVSGSTATVSLTEQQRQAAIGQPSPSLVLGAGAFRDVSGTGSAPATLPLQTAPDDDRPRLVTAALNTDTSVLVLEFDETMDESTFGAQLAHVRITGGAQEIPVSGTVSLDGVKVRVQVDRATLNAVLDSISASLRLETRGAQFEDTSGNAAPQADAELAIGDDSPPRLVSASVISPDTVLAIFHEDLDGSTVQPSDFEVGGLAPVSASEERGTVTLKLDAQYDERAAPTVSLAGSVSDLFGNAQNSGSVQSVNNIVRITVSEFTVSASGGLAVAGEQISISFRATEPVQNPALSINGDAVSTAPAENGFTASYAVPAGSPQGPLSVSLSVESRTGTPASFTERDLTGPNVSVDTVVPSVASASSSGVDSVTVRYSEPVLADASGASVEVSSATYAVSVSGSGSETILVYWDGDGSVPPSAILRGLAARDIAGNPSPAGPVNAGASSDTASPGPTGVLPIAKGTTLRTVTVPAGIEPALELSSASATDPRVLFAGGRTAELENPLSVITREPGLPDLFFQAGTEVGGLAGLTVAGADLEAVILVAPSDYEVPPGSPELDAYPQLRNPATAVLVGSPAGDIAFSKPVRMEFDVPLSGLVFSVGSAGSVLPIPACAEGYGGAVPLLQEAPGEWPPETYDPLACVSEDSVWTMHFSVFGVAHRVSGGSQCDDCTPPTLGYDSYGARLVDGGFAYNGLASDVEYFFTPYPLIESEVGKQNTVSLKIYENEGPQNIQHVSIAFGLRSGEVISESKAVINYDISFDGTGALSVIDPENAIGDSLSASHETVECAAGSALECLSVTVEHSFRAPLEFDIVGTDVWDSQRNSWQNYFNHGLRITGESMNPVPGVAVNGGSLILHPIAEGSNNVEVMAGEDGALYRLSPDGLYEPLRNISSLFHSIDESMYTYRGTPMQGYDRSDPEFAGMLEEQIQLAKAVL